MFILGIHNGEHDASACLFDDYRLIAAVSLERLMRKKNAGVSVDAELPFAAIDECLACAGIARSDIDVMCVSRAHFELQSYKLRGRWRIKQAWYGALGQKRLIMLGDILDWERLCPRYGFNKAKLWVYNHHAAHGVPAYFFSDFDDALIYTADGI